MLPARAMRTPYVANTTYGGFAYLVYPRWALGVNLPEPLGTLRNAKLGDLRLETGNLALPARVFRTPYVATPSTVVSRISFSALGIGCWAIMCAPPRNVSRNPTGRFGAPK